MIRSGIATIAVALALSSVPATAGPGGGRWDRLDDDGDGAVTLNELNERQRAFFSKADADGNGAITKEEMEALHEARRADMEAKRFPDADGDGVVSKAEYDAAADERFARLDKDGDGVLSKDEMKPARERGRRFRGKAD